MTKLQKRRICSKDSIFKFYNNTPSKYGNALCPTNLDEQRELFLHEGGVPVFEFKSAEHVESIVKKPKGKIHHHFFKEAVRILELTKETYGNGTSFLDESFGPTLDEVKATALLRKYLHANRVEGAFKILFTKDLGSSARMMWQGPNTKLNRPEARTYTMFIRNTSDNIYLRTKGIQCLANHEIGTHFLRMLNDGLQPWFSDRKKFGLRPLKSYELCQTEEGLATLNTVLQSNVPYLQTAALSYYTACQSEKMTFQELFQHLEIYVADPERRWRVVTRVKRGLVNPSGVGGYGGDQCYFEGAVKILTNLDNIDFQLLYAGKLCVDELDRVKRVARLECIRCPRFLRDVNKYKQKLRKIALLNKLIPPKQQGRAQSDLRNSAFGNRTLESPLSLRADTCLALYSSPREHLPRLSTTALSVNNPVDYTKDPDSGFVYPAPLSSLPSVNPENPSDERRQSDASTFLSESTAGSPCSKQGRLLHRPRIAKKHSSKSFKSKRKKSSAKS